MLSILALPSRRRWVTAAIGLGVQPGFNCIAVSQPLPAKQGRAMVKQISLPYRLHSSPLAWPLGAAPGFVIAAVVAERQGADRMPFIAGFDGQGRMLPGFPWLRGTPMQVTPGHALVMASPQGDLAAINVHGELRLRRDGRDISGGALGESLSLLAVAAVAVGNPVRSWLLLAADFRPHAGSRNALALLQGGRLGIGFPALLSGIPETQPPLVDSAGERAYMMLRSGQVDGFSLLDGRALPGFPTAPLDMPRPWGGFRLALAPQGTALFIASGSGALTRIELARGRAPTVGTVSTGGRQLAALAPLGGSMLAGWDAASGSLLTLDDQGRERHSMPLSQVYGDQAPFLLASGDDLAMVGAEANDTRARIDQAFAERAPAAGKAEVNAIAEEESQVRFGGPPRGSVQIAEAQSALRELKRGWLTRSLGLQKVDELLRAPAATRVTVVRGLSTAKPEPLAEDRIEGFTPQTGFQQCEHVLPVFWSDPRQASPTLLVGLNAAPRELPPGGAAALVRAYSLPER